MCGWADRSLNERILVELDHINENHHDNRLENLRVLCPNCHSLHATHRGSNKKVRLVNEAIIDGKNPDPAPSYNLQQILTNIASVDVAYDLLTEV